MSTPRRRIVRPAAPHTAGPSRKQRQLQKLRLALDRQRAALARWQTRLKRAFNAVLKHQKTIARNERLITQKEAS